MDQTIRLLGGIGLGAGLMYLLDPQGGRRRRALLRDQFARLSNEACDMADVTARDAANRARGLWAEARSAVAGKTPDDRTLTERVRSCLGRCVSHPRAVTVAADNGRVTLGGPVLADEVDTLMACVSGVPGVSGVENRLDVHQQAGNHPALQGGVRRTGARCELFQENWSPAVRLLTASLGVGLVGTCLARRDVASAVLGTVGLGLFLRAATNTSVGGLIGKGIPAPRVMRPEVRQFA